MGIGAASSCKTLEQFSTALEWRPRNKGHCRSIVHILDDFLFVGPTREKVASNLRNFKEIYTMKGNILSAEKIFEPARVIYFTEITLHAEHMEARLPDNKIFKMQQLLLKFQRCFETGLSPPVKYFTDSSKAVLLLWIICVILCFVYFMCSRLFIAVL